jgi:predicted nuclease of predicted toxin-antitoxin system
MNSRRYVSKDSDFQKRGVLHGQPPKFMRYPVDVCKNLE